MRRTTILGTAKSSLSDSLVAAESLNMSSISSFANRNIGKQTRAAALTVLIYDWTLTLDREVKCFWVKKLSFPKVLYFVGRYIAIISEIFDITVQSLSRPPAKLGRFRDLAWITGTQTADIFLIQVILTYRVYAVYERNRRILLILSVFLLCTSTATTAMIIASLKGTRGTVYVSEIFHSWPRLNPNLATPDTNQPSPNLYVCEITSSISLSWAWWQVLREFYDTSS
ncbi:hypothetical protein SISSUDRAFT_1047339 [Sistotremastrum suecicum HHB10207 ss-3]|uniref:DUF6533 domain-containing protein n=1 Tax=Sistotremastrum suecicum HHB10207 ss-3 TaxID=1314776 RepID=A0A166D7Z5_9AGAM|nr:hypothetical protein SISSUDRAFT_1047339 [Sistotremastrum suecicum HHB10207 ss-3]